jgi:uncharacterized membrane protein YgcG
MDTNPPPNISNNNNINNNKPGNFSNYNPLAHFQSASASSSVTHLVEKVDILAIVRAIQLEPNRVPKQFKDRARFLVSSVEACSNTVPDAFKDLWSKEAAIIGGSLLMGANFGKFQQAVISAEAWGLQTPTEATFKQFSKPRQHRKRTGGGYRGGRGGGSSGGGGGVSAK